MDLFVWISVVASGARGVTVWSSCTAVSSESVNISSVTCRYFLVTLCCVCCAINRLLCGYQWRRVRRRSEVYHLVSYYEHSHNNFVCHNQIIMSNYWKILNITLFFCSIKSNDKTLTIVEIPEQSRIRFFIVNPRIFIWYKLIVFWSVIFYCGLILIVDGFEFLTFRDLWILGH